MNRNTKKHKDNPYFYPALVYQDEQITQHAASETYSAHEDAKKGNMGQRCRWEGITKYGEQGLMKNGKVLRPRGHCNIKVTKFVIIETNGIVYQFNVYN